mgnify:FL=1|jgi:hypothetical protein
MGPQIATQFPYDSALATSSSETRHRRSAVSCRQGNRFEYAKLPLQPGKMLTGSTAYASTFDWIWQLSR